MSILHREGSRKALAAFDNKRFKTLLDFQTFNNLFKNAPSVVERTVQFESLSSTSIPRIFADKDRANLFRAFDDPCEELIKEFFSNAWFTGVELKCWVRGKEFTITPEYLAKVLHRTHSRNVDIYPYDDRVGL
ncbi:hypothetical protein SO802_016248 [Lithocarpus litseifolius]|uniref:Uncharacterized protein n=1 Tax=Lithocarpus litseifolius TaxID=425828 RepID=A0AAW2CVZ1_9ROSI